MSRSLSRNKYNSESDHSRVYSNLIDGFTSNVHYTKDKYLFYDNVYSIIDVNLLI